MKLLSPCNLGPLKLRNPVVFLPFYVAYANEEGMVTEQVIEHYKKVAKGGVGMVVVEASSIADAFASPFTIRAYDEKYLPGLTRLVEAIKAEGAKAAIQLNHTGRYSGFEGALAPSAVPAFGVTPKEMTQDDLDTVAAAFAQSALIAKKAGFDAVEIHGGTGYLLASFLSPRTNIRTDKYGGSTENRARFPMEVAQVVREKVGDDYPLGYRFMVREYLDDGLSLEEGIEAGKLIAKALNPIYWSVTTGSHECLAHLAEQKKKPGIGFMMEEAAAVKKAMPEIATIGAGHLVDYQYCEKALKDKKVDAVGLGRSFFADFDWVKKAQGEIKEDIVPCVLCDNCVRQISNGKPAYCVRWSKEERNALLESFPEERTKK